MQIVDKAVLAPSMCFICEKVPLPGTKVVDTARKFNPGRVTKLNGRKYVCQECVDTFLQLFGYASPEVVDKMRVDLEHAEAVISELQDRARQIAEAIVGDHAKVAPTVRSVPKRKPKADVPAE